MYEKNPKSCVLAWELCLWFQTQQKQSKSGGFPGTNEATPCVRGTKLSTWRKVEDVVGTAVEKEVFLQGRLDG